MGDAPKPLPDAYRDWIDISIDEEGISIPHGLIVADDGSLTVVALAVPPADGYKVMMAAFQERGAKEMIFAFDRFTKPGQGTTLGDVMAGHYCTRGATRPFIVEYQHEPRIVKPICWDNAYWNAALNRELLGTLRSPLGVQ